jgi:hypothetical protein
MWRDVFLAEKLNFSVKCWPFYANETESVWLKPGGVDAHGEVRDKFVAQLNNGLSSVSHVPVLH